MWRNFHGKRKVEFRANSRFDCRCSVCIRGKSIDECKNSMRREFPNSTKSTRTKFFLQPGRRISMEEKLIIGKIVLNIQGNVVLFFFLFSLLQHLHAICATVENRLNRKFCRLHPRTFAKLFNARFIKLRCTSETKNICRFSNRLSR